MNKLFFGVILSLAVGLQSQDDSSLYPPPFQTYDPLHQRSISFTKAGIAINLQPGDPNNPISNPNKLTLIRESGTATISLPDEIGQVDSITEIDGDRVAVKAMVNGERSEIVVLNWRLGQIVDRFLCYLPEISPNGKLIAFIKFYPAHGSEFDGRDHYMIYDLSKSQRDNRQSEISGDDRINVGKTIYPVGYENRPSDNVGKPSEAQYQMNSRIYWSADSENLVFAVRVGSELSLVWAEVSDGVAAQIKTLSIDTTALCGQAIGCLTVATDVVFSTSPTPSVTLRLTAIGRKTEVVTFPYSKFK